MIKCGTSFQHSVRQQKLKDLINDCRYDGKTGSWRLAVYQPGKHSAVNAKFWTSSTRDTYREDIISGKKVPKKCDGQVTIMIYRSGKMAIIGKSTKDLYQAYQDIVKLLRNHQDEIFSDIN